MWRRASEGGGISELTLLVEGHQSLGDSLTDSVDLGDVTTTAHTDTDVHTGELLLAQQQHGLLQLVLEHLGLDVLNWATVHPQESITARAVRDGCGGLLQGDNGRETGMSTRAELWL